MGVLIMLNAKVIGIGQAGNKAVINLLEHGVVNQNDIILINSTLKDIPEKYREFALKLEGSEGCAKERNIANNICKMNLQNGNLNVDALMQAEDSEVIICTSAEGGTGSGASSILAQYFSDVLGKTVHMFVFGGFETDVRGLKNTVEWFKETSPNYIVEAVCNSKFLPECNGNNLKAEAAANDEFVERIKILLGKTIVESETNIDDTDLLKLTTTPGFMAIEHGEIGKPKNVEEFNKAVSLIIDNSKSYDVEPTGQRLGVILNINDKIADSIDYQFNVIRKKFCEQPIEVFTHIQHIDAMPNSISIIVSGLKMPIEEIQEIYTSYKNRIEAVDKSRDSFFGMDFDTNTDQFDMDHGTVSVEEINKKKASFFGGSFANNSTVVKPDNAGKFQNIKKNDEV